MGKKEKEEQARKKIPKKKLDIVKECNGFFAFNTDQFKKGYDNLVNEGIVNKGDKVIHVGMGMYIPKDKKELFLKHFK